MAGLQPRPCIAQRVTLWLDEEVLRDWRAVGGKGMRYSDAAILCALSIRLVYKLPLR